MFLVSFVHNNPDLLFFMAEAALLAISLYLPLATGQLSLASPAFFAIGGYIAAIFSKNPTHLVWLAHLRGVLGPDGLYILEAVTAVLMTGLLGVVVGVISLRFKGLYLALATIAVVEIVQVLANNLVVTGGAVGIFSIPRLATPGQIWILLLVVTLLLWRLERTRAGRAFRAVRHDELAAESLGIRTTYYKVLAFTLGAALAGLVGVLGAHYLNTWNPRQGTFESGIDYLTWVIVGGSGSFLGPVVGAVFLTILPEVLRFLKDFRLIVDGVLLTVVTVLAPQGIMGLANLRARIREKSRGESPP